MADIKDDENNGAGHRQRLRERFLTGSLEGFHDYEIIELLLTLGTPRRDCKPIAKALIKEFRSLQGVCDASQEELCRVKGVGKKNTLGIKLIKAVSERYFEDRLRMESLDVIDSSKTLFQYLYHRLHGRARECFAIIFLNAKNRVIASEVLFKGTLTESSVYPREVIQAALEHHAAALILAHNHPSGIPTPSPADISLTRRLVAASMIMNLTIHEHIIIGHNAYYSFADHGELDKIKQEIASQPLF